MAKYDWVKRLDFSRFSAREQGLLILTACAVIVFLFVYLYLPAQRGTADLIEKKSRLQQELAQLEQEQALLAEEIKNNAAPEAGAAFTSYRLAALLELCHDLALEAGVELYQIRSEKAKELEGFRVHPILLDFRSGFSQAGRLLEKIAELPAPWQVEDLRVEADPEESSTVRAYLLLDIYLEAG